MRTLVILLATLCLGLTACTKKREKSGATDSKAQLSQSEAEKNELEKKLRNALGEFKQEKNPEKKIGYAVEIYRASLRGALSDKDSEVLGAASNYIASLGKEFRTFEERLTQVQRKRIGAAGKNSLVPFKSGVFFPVTTCNVDEYKKVTAMLETEKSKVSPISIMNLARIYEEENAEAYAGEIRKAINPEIYMNAGVLKSYLDFLLTKAEQRRTSGEATEEKAAAEAELQAAGIPDPRAYVFKMAKASPNCLGQFNQELIQFVEGDANTGQSEESR